MNQKRDTIEALDHIGAGRSIWWIAGLVMFMAGAGTVWAVWGDKTQQDDAAETKATQPVLSESARTACPDILIYESNNDDVTVEIDGGRKKIGLNEAAELVKYCVLMKVTDRRRAATSSSANQSEFAQSGGQDLSKQDLSEKEQSGTQNRAQSESDSASEVSQSEQSNSVSGQQSGDAASQQEQSQAAPAATLVLGSIMAPYINESDILSVNEAYSLAEDNPYWGFRHPGVDFMVDHDISVQAAYGGTIENLVVELSDGLMGWHAGFCIGTGTENSICYNLETFSSAQSVGDSLTAGLQIKNGDRVNQGDVLGQLIFGGSGAHIDFGVTAPGTRVCPEPYFTASAKESVLRLIHKDQPTWPMCYEP